MMSFLILEKTWDQIVFISLLWATLGYWISLSSQKYSKFFFISRNNLIFSNFIITIILLFRWFSTNHFPLSNLYESLLFLGWSLSFISFIIEFKINTSIIGALGAPLSMLVIGFATLSLPSNLQESAELVPALKSNWLMMHVSVMILSYAALMIGSLFSIVFLVITKGKEMSFQNYKNKSNPLTKRKSQTKLNTEVVNQSPNYAYIISKNKINLLESLDSLSYRTIGLGFPLLTIGIISGAVWANEAWGTYWSWDPKETWALITWLVFAAYLHARINKSWQGKKPALLASLGFVIVWICYLGVNFLGKGLHSYGWLN
uniref:Cytochrome c biogenesis protein CcsA n=1 Tax=Sciadococcus taiwanensis TaxID=3028030 RepID=A0A9Y1MWK8_9RHOD|nr:cytochrome c biogenesis protein [Sciadococcus taiwanensis]